MNKIENLCMKCMSDKGELKQCPFCGYVNGTRQNAKVAEKKTILQDKYVLGNIISENAESVCYIGYDIKNKSKVQVREFFPTEICYRDENGLNVVAKESCENSYETLKNDFLKYFRALAKVRDIDAIASVYDIFTDHGTAYIVSDMVDGITLFEFINRNKKPLDWDTAKMLFMPIISALGRLNCAGVLHLAVNPKSLIIQRNGKMCVSNFSTPNLRQIGIFSDFDFYKGFTAPEQYIKKCKLTQATDIYGLTASLFFALVGFAPKDASERETDDRLLIPVKLLQNISPHIVSALSNGLKINAQKRTQTFECLRDELTETSAKYLKEQQVDVSAKREIDSAKKNKKKNVLWTIGAAVFALTVLGSIFAFYMSNNTYQKVATQQDSLLAQNTDDASENITVPNFVGQNFESLQNNSSDDYNIFLAEKVFDDKIEEGKVISQTPAPETSVKKGSNIIVTVSKGPKFRSLPQIEGLTLSEVSAMLTGNGFIPVQESQYSNEVEQGKVIGYKGYKNGDKVEVGSQVTIIVSKGKR